MVNAMCDPFGLDCALQPFVGGNLIVADGILGLIATVVIWVCLDLMFSSVQKHGTRHGSGMESGIASFAIGFIFSILIGWFPVWVPFMIVFFIAWEIIDPMGGRSHG
jgi:hypothetical protein